MSPWPVSSRSKSAVRLWWKKYPRPAEIGVDLATSNGL
jgi:hypothetical protein